MSTIQMFTDLPEGPSYIPRPLTDPSRREGLACESGADGLLKPPQRLSETLPHRLLPDFDQPEGYAQQYDVQTIWHCAHYHVCYDPHDDHPCCYHIRSEADRLTLRVGPLALVPPKAVLTPRFCWPPDLEMSHVRTSAQETVVVEDMPLLVLASCEHGTVFIQERSAPEEPPLLDPIELYPEPEPVPTCEAEPCGKKKHVDAPSTSVAPAPSTSNAQAVFSPRQTCSSAQAAGVAKVSRARSATSGRSPALPSTTRSAPRPTRTSARSVASSFDAGSSTSGPATSSTALRPPRTRHEKNRPWKDFTCGISNCTHVLTSDELWVTHLQDTHEIGCKHEWKAGSSCPCCPEVPEEGKKRKVYGSWSTWIRHHKDKHHYTISMPCPVGGGCTFVLEGLRGDSMKRHLMDKHKMTSEDALSMANKSEDKENVPPAEPDNGEKDSDDMEREEPPKRKKRKKNDEDMEQWEEQPKKRKKSRK